MRTNKITTTLDVPNEAGATITIRRLSHHQLMMAIDRRQDAAIDKLNKIADPSKLPKGDNEAAEEPRQRYDRMAILRAGVVDWSYAEDVTDEALEDQDEAWASWAFDEIIAFSIRSAEEKKDSDSDSPRILDLAAADGRTN